MRDDPINFLRVIGRIFGGLVLAFPFLRTIPLGNYLASGIDRFVFVLCWIVAGTGDAGVHFGTPEFLNGYFLAGCGLHQGRSTEKDGAGAPDDDAVIRKAWN